MTLRIVLILMNTAEAGVSNPGTTDGKGLGGGESRSRIDVV